MPAMSSSSAACCIALVRYLMLAFAGVSAATAQGNGSGEKPALKLDGNVGLRTNAGSQIAADRDKAPDDEFPLRPDGDLGLGVFRTRSIIRGRNESPVVLPYAYIDYGRLFARIDTIGVKTLKLGHGHLEFSGRVELDGYKTNTPALQGLSRRRDSLPLGISSLQEFPWGAVFVDLFHDVNQSKGNLFDVAYVGKVSWGKATLYPQAGVEYLTRQYTGYYYGVSAQEVLATGARYRFYQPGGASNPFVAGMLEINVAANWNVNLFLRRKWLAAAIHDSPIVGSKVLDTAFLSLAYRFK